MRYEKYLLILLTLMVVFLTRNYIYNTLKDFYLLNAKPTKIIRGTVKQIDKVDDLQGARSYTYVVEYSPLNTPYKLVELFSPDSLPVSVNDEVMVKYSTLNPAYATLKNNSERWSELGLATMLVIIELIMLFQVFKILNAWYKRQKRNI